MKDWTAENHEECCSPIGEAAQIADPNSTPAIIDGWEKYAYIPSDASETPPEPGKPVEAPVNGGVALRSLGATIGALAVAAGTLFLWAAPSCLIYRYLSNHLNLTWRR